MTPKCQEGNLKGAFPKALKKLNNKSTFNGVVRFILKYILYVTECLAVTTCPQNVPPHVNFLSIRILLTISRAWVKISMCNCLHFVDAHIDYLMHFLFCVIIMVLKVKANDVCWKPWELRIHVKF